MVQVQHRIKIYIDDNQYSDKSYLAKNKITNKLILKNEMVTAHLEKENKEDKLPSTKTLYQQCAYTNNAKMI